MFRTHTIPQREKKSQCSLPNLQSHPRTPRHSHNHRQWTQRHPPTLPSQLPGFSGKQGAAAPLGIPSLGGNGKQTPQKEAVGVMSSRHCGPAVTISGPFPLRLPGTAGSCGNREAGREERAGKQQLLPWMSAGRKAVGREGRRSSLQAWGAGSVRVAKAAQLLQPSPAARPCLLPKEALESEEESCKGLCYIRGTQKGEFSPFMSPFTHPEQFAPP